MKRNHYLVFIVTSILMFAGWCSIDNYWLIEKHSGYSLIYTPADSNNIKEYNILIENGMSFVKLFFNTSYDSAFNVIIHPDRNSLDSAWQKDWNMPEFKSECWMVASGVSNKLDIISPIRWNKEACEHIYSESIKTQLLVTHELVHVFHGQKNISKDFSATEGIDWFIEGLAVYASGQLDSLRLSDVKEAIINDKIPERLNNFWSGKIKYGLSGSIVMFIDYKYGREKIKELLPLCRISEVLAALNVTEPQLLDDWKIFITNL